MSTKKKLLEAAAGNAGGEALYVDDVFSTYLYEGNSSTQTITNGIDLDGEGGLVWIKDRTLARNNNLYDTDRIGTYPKHLVSDSSAAEIDSLRLSSFNSDGFSLASATAVNGSAEDYVSWTFRKAPGFFDIVTYTGTGTAGNRTIPHNLGSVPGMIVVKDTAAGAWYVWHRSYTYPLDNYQILNQTNGVEGNPGDGFWGSSGASGVTSTGFSISGNGSISTLNNTYVAYLFAHDAQEFGADEDESIIKCGSYNGSSSSASVTVDLGWEPQYVLIKSTVQPADWYVIDTMRGMPVTGVSATLLANTSGAESDFSNGVIPTATGFTVTYGGGYALNHSSSSYIYMAIRRPHKPAEEFAATDLFNTDAGRSDGLSPAYELGFPPDMGIQKAINGSVDGNYIFSRLTGNKYVFTDATSVEVTGSAIAWDYMNGIMDYFNGVSFYNAWGWRRAPGYFDVVAYTGTGSARTVTHNLGVAPEMMWVKGRTDSFNWVVYAKPAGNGGLILDSTTQYENAQDFFNNTHPTDSVFSVSSNYANRSSQDYIAYLFASVAGISKVGSYTGTGSDLNVDCGFSAGAKFVLIKRTDSSGDWYYWDTLRGIVAGNDPYLLLNSSAAQVTNTDYIDPLASGFTVTSSASAALNASGGSYIFYAIA